jgi:hypothetical protein
MNNGWEQRFGARRRQIDRKLLAEVEAQIAREERAIVPSAANPVPPVNRDEARLAIARAFGRPLN